MRPQDTAGFGPVGTNGPKKETPDEIIQRLEVSLKRAREDLQEYITAEKVMIAAGKVSEATVRQAHELVQNLK